MDSLRLAFFEGLDGARVALGGDGALANLLTNGEVRRFLVHHGLSVEERAGMLCMPAGELTDALMRAADAFSDAPDAVRRHPLLGEAEVLVSMAGAVGNKATRDAKLLVPFGGSSAALDAADDRLTVQEVAHRLTKAQLQEVPALLAALQGDEDAFIGLGPEQIGAALIRWLHHDETAQAAAQLLSLAECTDAVRAMMVALARAVSLDVRAALLIALVDLGERDFGMRTLRTMLLHGRPAVRGRAIAILATVCTESDAAALYEMQRLARPDEALDLAAMVYELGDARGYGTLARRLDAMPERTSVASAERVLRALDRICSRRFLPLLRAYERREDRLWLRARARSIGDRIAEHGKPEQPPERLLQTGEELYYSNRTEPAIEALEELLALEPSPALTCRGNYVYANCLREAERLDEALVAIEAAVAAKWNDWRAHRLRGSVLWDLGRHADSIDAYDRALTMNPTDAYTWYYKGYVLYRLKRDTEALPCLDRALSLKRDAAYIYNQKAFCLERLGNHVDAVSCYRRSLELQPEDPIIRDYLGQALQAAGRLEQALACYDAVLSAAPDNVDSLYHRADVLYDLERWQEASSAFELVLETRPDSYSAWFNRGLCLRFLGRFRQAALCFEEALSLRPDSNNAAKQLEYCLQR